ncbi:phage tail protein [Nostoc sp. FACHB-152]|uniref:phage tail protein n=1 Tax=unclassified Nostoc TaxID=2593658 RepID=UPI00168A2E3B|nr:MULTISPECIES: phage tail protein [unclassified Nostoc]MBD2449048.1 phage tail protein [Nostoc sp. FACHB-152]MBD2471048.1 phage tail protein [Nostoc sp. FACHB-145]
MNAKQSESESVSTYQQYLPAILQKDAFISKFLLAFENILSGVEATPSQKQIITANTQNVTGLEEIVDNIHLYFNPQQTPEEFLPWLAGWVALSLRDDWALDFKKAFIQQIVRLYRLRGTKQGLIEILQIYLENSGFGNSVEIFDEFDYFPNYFQVQLTLKDRDPDKYWRQAKIAKAIIDQEKPAHTFYTLKILVPTMQLTKRSHFAYPFKLFATPPNQKFALEVTITPNNINNISLNQLAQQLLVQIQGNSKIIKPSSPEILINNQSFSVKQNLNYQNLQENFAGFNVTLSNRTDKQFIGNLTIKLYFFINDTEYNNTLIEQPVNLSPVLKICRQNEKGEIIAGNTIFQQNNQLQQPAMQLTESIWTKPYRFQTFEPPKIQKLQPNLIAIIEKLEIATIVEITQPNTITSDLLNKITVRLQDNLSEYHLLTPETIIENNKIIIKRTLYYQQFLQTLDQLTVTIKNLNNVEIVGKVTVQASLNINQRLSTYKLLEQTFNLAAVPPFNILQICSKDEEGKIVAGNTILGTSSQSLN